MTLELDQAIHLLAEALNDHDQRRDRAIRDMALRMQRRKRWPGDVDEIAVERAMAGDRVTLTEDEMRAVVTELARQGMPDPEIAKRIHRTPRTVLRLRQRNRIESRWTA